MTDNLETRVAVLDNEIDRVIDLLEKTETTIQKLSEVSNNLVKIIAVHDEKIIQHNAIHQEIFSLVEKRKDDLQKDIKELHSRITTVSRELSDDIIETERRLMSAFQEGLQGVKQCITDEYAAISPKNEDLEKRIAELEKWRWVVIGGSVIVGTFAHEILGSFLKAN